MDMSLYLGLIGKLLVDCIYSWSRMFIALGISVIVSIILGIYIATSRKAEKLLLPVIDIFQTLPILAFFPIVIYVFVGYLPGYIGINAAVIFLIITSMIWNIIFGVYEAIKTIPAEFFEMSEMYGLTSMEKLKTIYLPAAAPRIVQQSILSWSIGLFYLVTSEIFSTGTAQYSVKYGIGAALASAAITSNITYYLTGIAMFVVFVIATRMLFFKPLEDYYSRYYKPQSNVNRYLNWRSIVKLPNRLFTRMQPAPKTNTPSREKTYPKGGVYISRTLPSKKSTDASSKKRAALLLIILIAAVTLVAYAFPTVIKDEAFVVESISFSFVRIWLVFVVILAISVPVSVYLIFISKNISRYIIAFQIIASIPSTILLPAIISTLRTYPHPAELTAIMVYFISGIWYLIFSAIGASKSMPFRIDEVKKVFGIRGIEAWKKIYIPAIIPGLITGAVTAIAAEWNVSIVAEYFVSGNSVTQVGIGIGKLLNLALNSNNLLLMLIGLINLSAMIILINTFLWKRLYRKATIVYR